MRAEVRVEGAHLVSRGNGRRMRPGTLTVPSLDDLRRATPGAPATPRLTGVVAAVPALHLDPPNAGATFQVASRFNLLEMPGPDVTPDDGIAACAIACGAGTLWRNCFVPHAGGKGQSADRQTDALADLGAALGNDVGRFWRMRNGYALPRPAGLQAVSIRIAKGALPRCATSGAGFCASGCRATPRQR